MFSRSTFWVVLWHCCTGREHTFEVTYHEAPLGFGVTAAEVGKGGLGYEFSAFDATSPYLALYSVRQKIERTLATRYVERKGPPHHVPTHDVLRGRITAGDGEAIFVIDGEPLSMEEFGKLVCTCEGWEFEFRFLDRRRPRRNASAAGRTSARWPQRSQGSSSSSQ